MNKAKLILLGVVVAAAVVAASVMFQKRPARLLTAPLPTSVYLEDATWVELREAINAGRIVAIVPTGGTEQNGPHGILGKHNYIVKYTAGEVAKRLGNAMVTPVIAYVPEGDIDAREGHMAFPGTISIPDDVFAGVLEATARSLKAHGFKLIAFLGDSGGNQAAQAEVAAKLTAEWADDGVRVINVAAYYDPEANGEMSWLLKAGETAKTIGRHMGIRDTSELMAVHPEGIRNDRIAVNGGNYDEPTGVNGDPTRASAERGQTLISFKIDAAVTEIDAALRAMKLLE